MTPEEWQRVRPLLESALELDSAHRAAYLDGACIDPSLRREVESLIAVHEQASTGVLNGTARPTLIFDEEAQFRLPPGKRIGVYEIIEEIAQGGMGAVYRAIRADGQYKQQVALKIVRADLGVELTATRFRNERQILASLDQPNIAKILDGGTTADGLPYFVMEFIDGLPITEYCDAHKLSIDARLSLFRTVCSAVHYAHQHLVIHRDLKPSNILVTPEGIPKLLDFGIAKILDRGLVQETMTVTAAGLWMMTPEYASPEQFRGEGITTATDVYSLGLVLYELLTGSAAYNFSSRMPHEIARVVLETDPKKPSTAIQQKDGIVEQGVNAPTTTEFVTGVRGASPEKLRKRIRGDLDNIVMKAIRKEPAERYSSADQLSDDIRRHLEHLPVLARKSTLAYRWRKYVLRHKVGVAAAALVFLSLLTGVVLTLREARIARANQRRAEKRFNDVRKLSNSLIFEIHDSIQSLPGATPARKLLVSEALQYLDSLSQDAVGDASLQRELATAYQKLGDVQGFTNRSNLGDTAGALQSYGKALKIREALRAANPKDRQALSDLGAGYRRMANIRLKMGDFKGSLENSRRSFEIEQSLVATDPTNSEARAYLASSYDAVGDALVELNQLGEAKTNYEEELALFKVLQAADSANMRASRDLSIAYKKVGGISEATGDLAQAIGLYRQAIAIDDSLASANPTNALLSRDLSISYVNIGDVLMRMGRLSEATDSYNKALTIDETLAAADPKDANARKYLRSTYEKIGNVLLKNGQTADALSTFRRALAAAEAQSVADRMDVRARSDLAAYSSRIGNAYATLAANSSVHKSREYWQQARSWYQKSQGIWLELRQRGSVAPREDGESPETASQGLARCDAALAKLKVSPPA